MANPIQIILPSFLRRVMRAYAIKALMRSTGCELNRIGRSRNWQLKATLEQLEKIVTLIESSDEDTWQWVAERIRKHHQSYTFESLMRIAKYKPGITVNELVAKTDCTVAEARKVIDELEWQ